MRQFYHLLIKGVERSNVIVINDHFTYVDFNSEKPS